MYEAKQFASTEAHGHKPPSRHYLRSWRSKVRKAKAKMDTARTALEKRLMEHRAQVEELKKGYRFHPEDTSTYSLAAAIPKGDLKVRSQLLEDWKQEEEKNERWRLRNYGMVLDSHQLVGE